MEYDGADEPKPINISLVEIVTGPDDLTIAYQYQLGDPRVTLDPEYVGFWYLYPSDEGRVIVSALYRGPKPDNTRVFVALDLVKATDSLPPTLTVEDIPDKVSGNLTIKGTAVDGSDSQSSRSPQTSSRVRVIQLLTEIFKLLTGRGRDYNGHHIEAEPSGVDLVKLRYNGQDQQQVEPNANGSFQFVVDTTKLADGEVTFEVTAIDKAGNQSEPTIVTTTIDNLPDPPPPDPWDQLVTVDRRLVPVDEPVRYFGPDSWPKEDEDGDGEPDHYYGYTMIQAIAFKNNGAMLVYAGQVIEYLFGETIPQLYPEGGVWGGGGDIATNLNNNELYVTGALAYIIWRFSPDGYFINKATDVYWGANGPGLIDVDRQGYVWVFFGRGRFACYHPDLTPVEVTNAQGELVPLRVEVPASDTLAFAADLEKDALIWYRWNPDLDATQIMRRRIFTGEDTVLATFKPSIGISGIELDSVNGQVLVFGSFRDGGHIVQLGKRDEWGEIYRSDALDQVQELVLGANFNEYYVYYGDMTAQRWHYQ
jgi:hypothetical protein